MLALVLALALVLVLVPVLALAPVPVRVLALAPALALVLVALNPGWHACKLHSAPETLGWPGHGITATVIVYFEPSQLVSRSTYRVLLN